MDARTEQSIRATIADYVTGMTYGDADLLARAFHPRGVSVGHFDGALEWMSVGEFAASCKAEALDSATPLPPWEIETLHRSGDTALVIVTNSWAGFRFRDTLTLLKEGGRWRIVFKCFDHLG